MVLGALLAEAAGREGVSLHDPVGSLEAVHVLGMIEHYVGAFER
jgi:hypothetical protein